MVLLFNDEKCKNIPMSSNLFVQIEQKTNHSWQILPDALNHGHFCEGTQDILDVEGELNPKLELLMTTCDD